jgi:transmembrane sensor
MTNPPESPSDTPDPALAQWLSEHHAPDEPEFDVDRAWADLERWKRGRPAPATVPMWHRALIVAAAASVIAAVVTFVMVSRRAASASNDSVDLIERVAPAGRPQIITLDDGSRITLNGGSTVRYPSTGNDRDVYLDGEALFEITHDPQRAFRVHAAHGMVRDIGTKFTVRAYTDDHAVQVAVTEGSVAFMRDSTVGPRMDLAAGDAAAMDSAGTFAKLPPAAVERLFGWTTGALIFDNARLSAAASEIEHHYGVHVVVADSALARRPVVARFHGEPIRQVLDAIAVAVGAHYDIAGTTYTLRPGRK